MRGYETQLEFSGSTGRAVVVDCDLPWRFVFWDKAQYVGCVDVGGGTWFTSEWCETNSPNDHHCYEPIMDKQLRWVTADLIENGPARCRVKYSYRLPDMRYRVFHGNTRAEEFYTIYPDGVALRHVFRKRGEDRAEFTLHPSAPQINPVVVINGWGGDYASVSVDGAELPQNDYRAQVSGDDLVVWVRGTFAAPTRFKIVGQVPESESG